MGCWPHVSLCMNVDCLGEILLDFSDPTPCVSSLTVKASQKSTFSCSVCEILLLCL